MEEYIKNKYDLVISNEKANGSKEKNLEDWYITELMLDEIHSDILEWLKNRKK